MPTVASITELDQSPATCSAQSDDRRIRALEIRREWMTALGLEPDEIDLHCGSTAIADLDEELAQRTAMEQLARLNESRR